jgi:hypothetical protein
MPINLSTGCIDSEAQCLPKRACTTGPQDHIAMPKVLESVSNISTNSARPIQFRSINGTKVLALVLLFVFSAMSAVFLLLQ